jgi:hypothetical protein
MMNPGAAEEAGKATGTFLDIMRQQPLSLALVVMNLALLVLIYFSLSRQADVRSHDLDLMNAQAKEVQTLLSQCVVPK